jgi:hypothetical protein
MQIKVGPSPWAIVLLVIGALIGVFGVALGVNTGSKVIAGVLGAVVVAAALAGLASRTEIRDSQITTRSPRGRRTLRLDQLASADYTVGRGRYGRIETLTLTDQAGTKVALLLSSYGRVKRQQTLAMLAPVVMADGVRRSGPIDQAFQGGY